MAKRPGKLVRCSDGRIGRTYNDESLVNGRIRVYVFSEKDQHRIEAVTQEEIVFANTMQEGKAEIKRLCPPESLTVIGMAD